MRVLLFNIYFHPDPTGTAAIFTQLAEDLVDAGDEVTVVSSFSHHAAPATSPRRRGPFAEAEHRGVRVLRTVGARQRRKTLASTVVNYASYSALSAAAAVYAGSYDVVLCGWPPLTVGPAALLAARRRGVPLVLDVQDLYTPSLVGRGAGAINGVLERTLLRRADRAVVLCAGMKQEVVRRGIAAERVSVLENWADVDRIRPMSRSTPLRREYGLDGCFVALFTGNVGSYSSVHTAVEAASLLADLPEFRLVVAGRGNARPALEEQVRSLGLRNTLFLDTQPPERLAELFASADVSLVTLDERIRRTAVPSKLLTILASGRPAIVCASPDNEAATIVREGRCGTALPPDDPPALARELRRAMAEGDRLQAEGARGRELAVARYSRASQTARYRMLLHEVVSQPDG